jgi:hypothetical protein
MAARPPEDPLPSGWLPPRPPAHPTSPEAPQRIRGAWPPVEPRKRPAPQGPSSPQAVTGIACGVAAIVLLALSAGVWFPVTIALSLAGLLLGTSAQKRIAAGSPGRPGQARLAIALARWGLGLAAVAAIAWGVLALNDITPSDLQQALTRERERLQRR